MNNQNSLDLHHPRLGVQIGFFDTREEEATTREVGKEFRPGTVDEIEGKRHRVRTCLNCNGLSS